MSTNPTQRKRRRVANPPKEKGASTSRAPEPGPSTSRLDLPTVVSQCIQDAIPALTKSVMQALQANPETNHVQTQQTIAADADKEGDCPLSMPVGPNIFQHLTNRGVSQPVSTHGSRPHSMCTRVTKDLTSTANHLLASAISDTTTAAYKHTFKLYREFIHNNIGDAVDPLPPNVQHLALFVAHCYEQNLAASTMATYNSALGYIFKLGNYEDITQHFIIKKMLSGFQKQRSSVDSRLPITPNILKALIESLDHTIGSFFTRCMFKAMFLLAFHAFLRIGEITMTGSTNQHYLHRQHVVVTENSIDITFPHFKHSNGPSNILSVTKNDKSHCPVKAIRAYLAVRQHKCLSEPLFSLMDGTPISRQYFTKQLRLSLRWSGCNPNSYKAHSFRIGAATTAASQGISEERIQVMGRWKSDAFKKYVRIPMIQI